MSDGSPARNVIVLYIFLAFALRGGRAWLCVALVMLVAGAAENLTGRPAYGRVVDWLPLPCPFFGALWMNAADIRLIAGAGILAFRLFFARGERD